jgi:hypothetical protein
VREAALAAAPGALAEPALRVSAEPAVPAVRAADRRQRAADRKFFNYAFGYATLRLKAHPAEAGGSDEKGASSFSFFWNRSSYRGLLSEFYTHAR